MKLLRYGAPNQEKPGLLDAQGNLRDLSAHVADIDGKALTSDALNKLRALDVSKLPVVSGNPRLGPCVGNVGKLICIGLNYTDHAIESNMAIPTEPVVFMKATSSICGPYDDVEIPPNSIKNDWEVELGIVIGKQTKYVSEKDALQHVAGYCIVNDVSERAWQLEHGTQWSKGKSFDTYGPIGPWMVTADEIPDVQNLAMWLEVDGKRYQDGTTKNQIFTVAQVVSYLSQFMSMQPGDLIATGTPAGVGFGMKPPVYLRTGQTMRLSIEGLGEQLQKTVPARVS